MYTMRPVYDALHEHLDVGYECLGATLFLGQCLAYLGFCSFDSSLCVLEDYSVLALGLDFHLTTLSVKLIFLLGFLGHRMN